MNRDSKLLLLSIIDSQIYRSKLLLDIYKETNSKMDNEHNNFHQEKIINSLYLLEELLKELNEE